MYYMGWRRGGATPYSWTIGLAVSKDNEIEGLITDKTVAIIPVHVYGNGCNIEAIQEIADRYKLPVIYDAAHSFGVKYKGCGIGNYGDVSVFSFHATKVFNTIEGGAVIANKAGLTIKYIT